MDKETRTAYRHLQTFALTICLILAAQTALRAQEASGKVVGTVTDQQGAVIPDAKVVVTNTGTTIRRETVADKEGNFQVLSVPVGTYQVSVEREGFKSRERPRDS
jgi:hypothetical protein